MNQRTCFLDLLVSLDCAYNFTFISLFVCSSFSQEFFQNWLISYSDFLYEFKGLQMVKSDGTRFLWKVHFCLNMGKKYPKIGQFAKMFFTLKGFFLDVAICFSEKQFKMKSFSSFDFSSQALSVKFFCQGLSFKMFLTNQIAGFFKGQYFQKKLREQINFWFEDKQSCYYYYYLWWVWPGTSKVSIIASLQYFRNISRKR